jgi:DNA helicase-2/ATP-dependent DNA helicase PcrA
MFVPRPHQREVLEYRRGYMGVSAVPGSGKTEILSRLAADIILRGDMADDQEVLIVTLVNSAVDNFAHRVSGLIEEHGLLPFSHRVRTLHGLAHDIVRERPSIAGLSDDFQIVDERIADQIRADVVQAWLHGTPYDLDDYIDAQIEDNKRDWIRREPLPALMNDLALSFIRYAKDNRLTPESLHERLEHLPVPLPLAEIGYGIFADYQRSLAYRGAVDFDDLIRLALYTLEQDGDYLIRLRQRWPFILEDEAQDSSKLQEKILRLLAGQGGNWVRVGDPNQAIFETFTTASPQFLINFMEEADARRTMPDSGRSTKSIIALANHLIDWAREDYPVEGVRDALTLPHIEPVPEGDSQYQPEDDPGKIHLHIQKMTPAEEIQAVVDSLIRWLPDHQDKTVAVLVPRNTRGFEVVNELKNNQIDHLEILRSTASTRVAAGVLGNVVNYLADPQSASKLSKVYQVWRRNAHDGSVVSDQIQKIAALLRKCQRVEDYISPQADRDWLANLALDEDQAVFYEELLEFREVMQRWQGTTLLPIDQVILTLAQELFTEPADLAVAHKLAVLLRRVRENRQDWRLPELTQELAIIARNERRFLGFSEDDVGFDPELHRGKVVVTTMHKAKGLEWDRVYLLSVNTYDFPTGFDEESYIAERWFVRERLNLEAEAMAQLDAALSQDQYSWYTEGQATQKARREYAAERLRLLYVGITRAKSELIITWNSGRRGDQFPAAAFVELQTYWQARYGNDLVTVTSG